jgi:hypothetical protein
MPVISALDHIERPSLRRRVFDIVEDVIGDAVVRAHR